MSNISKAYIYDGFHYHHKYTFGAGYIGNGKKLHLLYGHTLMSFCGKRNIVNILDKPWHDTQITCKACLGQAYPWKLDSSSGSLMQFEMKDKGLFHEQITYNIKEDEVNPKERFIGQSVIHHNGDPDKLISYISGDYEIYNYICYKCKGIFSVNYQQNKPDHCPWGCK